MVFSLPNILRLLIATLGVFSLAYAADDLGQRDHIETSRALTKIIQPTVDSFFKGDRFASFPPAKAFVTFTFDEERFQQEKKIYLENVAKKNRAMEETRKIYAREMYNEVLGRESAKIAKTKPHENTIERDAQTRFGRLNIDLDPMKFSDHLEEAHIASDIAAKNQPNIALQIPNPIMDTETHFNYEVLSFIKSLTIELALPETTEDHEINELKRQILQDLSFLKIELHTDSSFTIIKIKKILGDYKNLSFTEWLFAPNNPSLGILIAAIFVGIAGITCIFLLARVFSRIAGSIAELKPEPAADTIGGTVNHDASGMNDDSVVINAEAEDIPARSSHDPAAALSAMTSEMRTIRDQLAEIVQDNSMVVSELLRDLCYEKFGMEDFRDLLSFAGYSCIKESMEKLPESVILQLQAYIEDNRDSQVNLIRGCEVAQRIYRDTVSKISVKSEATDHMKNLKDALIKIDDKPLDQVVEEASANELAMILRTLSVERGNRLMRSLEGPKLKEACDLLDSNIENETHVAKELIEKLAAAQSTSKTTSQLQTRFILRLAKTASIYEEEALLTLVEPNDWNLKHAILSSRFLYSYIKYMPGKELRSIFDSFELNKRAEILFIMGSEIKDLILSQYPEGSKMIDMITDELSNVENNKKRRESVEKNKTKLTEDILNKIRHFVATHADLVTTTLTNEFEALGLTLPTHINAEISAEPNAA